MMTAGQVLRIITLLTISCDLQRLCLRANWIRQKDNIIESSIFECILSASFFSKKEKLIEYTSYLFFFAVGPSPAERQNLQVQREVSKINGR